METRYVASRRFGLDFFLRAVAAVATLVATIISATNKQARFGLTANYKYSPAFTYYIVTNVVACFYSILSMFASSLRVQTLLFATIDVVMVGITASGVSAAGAVAYVGFKGNSHTGWMEVCSMYSKFCWRGVGAAVPGLLACYIFMGLSINAIYSFKKREYATTK